MFFKVIKCPSLSSQKSISFPILILYYYVILQCCSLSHCLNFSLFEVIIFMWDLMKPFFFFVVLKVSGLQKLSFQSLIVQKVQMPWTLQRKMSLIILQSLESFHKPLLNVSITTGTTLHQLTAISCNVSFRSVFPSQPSKPSLNLMLSVDTKLLIWWRSLWSRLLGVHSSRGQ